MLTLILYLLKNQEINVPLTNLIMPNCTDITKGISHYIITDNPGSNTKSYNPS